MSQCFFSFHCFLCERGGGKEKELLERHNQFIVVSGLTHRSQVSHLGKGVQKPLADFGGYSRLRGEITWQIETGLAIRGGHGNWHEERGSLKVRVR